MKINRDRVEEVITTDFRERNQKLKFAIWDQMEFLSENLKIDDPEEVINLIKKSVNEAILEYSPMDESFDEGFEN